MLLDLHVKNLSVMAEASVELGPGLNVLTGETGAGKSLLVDSLSLLAGSRASVDMIRTGADTLAVTGIFAPDSGDWRGVLQEAGLEAGEDEEELMIRREISRSGKNRVFVNDQPATLRLLSRLAPSLLRVHGQREELGLIAPELQRRWLDRSGGDESADLLLEVAAFHRAWRELHEQRQRLLEDARRRDERIDQLSFEAKEIDAIAPQEDELEELGREVHLLRHASAIREALSGAYDLLIDRETAVSASLSRSSALLLPLDEGLSEAAEWCRELDELRIRSEEVGTSVLRRMQGIDTDPQHLDRAEERLSRLERVARKYGPSTAEVLEHRRVVGEKLAELADLDGRREELDREVEEALSKFRDRALELSKARERWGHALGERILGELEELALGSSRFALGLGRRTRADSELDVDGVGVDYWAHGLDVVTFLFTPNPGEDLQPLSRAASGGELSRLYLALQLAVGGEDGNPSLVFDEIDAGIGGAEAAFLGGKLARLAKERQVLVLTHLPQVASHSDRHFKVRKGVKEGRTEVAVSSLAEPERIEEVARMLAGHEITELSLSHARELVEGAARSHRS